MVSDLSAETIEIRDDITQEEIDINMLKLRVIELKIEVILVERLLWKVQNE